MNDLSQAGAAQDPGGASSSPDWGLFLDWKANRPRLGSNLFSIFTPIVGAILALALVDNASPTRLTWIVFGSLFVPTLVGVMLGYHRYFTHGSFATFQPIRFALAVFATWAMQGSIVNWVADHRRHHKYADKPGDPHSPYWYGSHRFNSLMLGLVHAHLLWMFRPGVTDLRRYVPDLLRDPIVSWMSRHYVLVATSSLALPTTIGFLAVGAEEALRCFLWAGCVRVILIQHFTWGVNSLGHRFGKQDVASKDESRDNSWTFPFLIGEGLHNYHHRYPYAAVNAPVWLDPTGCLVAAGEKLGLVWEVRRAKEQRKRVRPEGAP